MTQYRQQLSSRIQRSSRTTKHHLIFTYSNCSVQEFLPRLQSTCTRGSLTPPQAKNAFSAAAGVTSKISCLFSLSFWPCRYGRYPTCDELENWLSPKGLQKHPSKSPRSCLVDNNKCINGYLFVLVNTSSISNLQLLSGPSIWVPVFTETPGLGYNSIS